MTDHAAIGRKARKVGQGAESIVACRLRALGLLCVERIETGFRVKRCGNHIVGASPMAKVSGDFHAIAPGGAMVIVECKWRPEVLQWSALDAHQVDALNRYAGSGALALLAWVHETGMAVMRWPLPYDAFRPGHSLTPHVAASLNITSIKEKA